MQTKSLETINPNDINFNPEAETLKVEEIAVEWLTSDAPMSL